MRNRYIPAYPMGGTDGEPEPRVRRLKKNCIVCGQKFEYVSNGIYEPETCLEFECNKKKLHPELKKVNS